MGVLPGRSLADAGSILVCEQAHDDVVVPLIADAGTLAFASLFNEAAGLIEPRRVCRRLVAVSYAAMSSVSIAA